VTQKISFLSALVQMQPARDQSNKNCAKDYSQTYAFLLWNKMCNIFKEKSLARQIAIWSFHDFLKKLA
jgi:hypothetical protein